MILHYRTNHLPDQKQKPVSIKHGLRTADCGLRTTDCGLGIKYGLGIKRGLENTDWV